MTEPLPRVRAYVDGFNFYYGALRRRPAHKWLDVHAWAENLTGGPVDKTYYCTARVAGQPDPTAPARQDNYFTALGIASPHLEIVRGKFSVKETRMHRLPDSTCSCCDSAACGQPSCKCCTTATVAVTKTEEKGSDVNLAVLLVRDALRGEIDRALVVSGDSDLRMAVQIARDAGVEVWVADPHGRRNVLAGDRNIHVSAASLASAQLPDPVVSKGGRNLRRPDSWK